MDAKTILQALKNRHWQDVFVPECKTGPTWYNPDLRILDVWVMKRSWVHFGVIGYEIKVCKSDFKSDNKWREYLPYCHQFYFICPWGLIQPEEIDGDAGLCWVSKNGQRIYTKKKVVQRDIDIHPGVLLYILMSRTVVIRQHEIAMLNSERLKFKRQLTEIRETSAKWMI